ncbi:MAG: hypothetical protein H6799_03315 [Candidatus Nomurabacteria bacterium]|nr:MAG: hypothetical protein H6799_03315 [Candidatus Nomurabacteria bacterium]
MEELGSIEPQVTATDMQRVESIARAAVGSQLPPGMSIEDAAQDVWVLALTKGSNSLEGSPSFIGNVAKGSVRREAARALSGNNAYLRAIKISLSGQEIVTSSNVLGSCAQRRAYYKAKGLPSPGLDEGKDIYGIVRFSDGTEMMDPAAVAEYKIILSDLIGPVFV